MNPATRSSTIAAWSPRRTRTASRDRKSTRLNSSHGYISYAVFCLQKKKARTRRAHAADLRHAVLRPARGGGTARRDSLPLLRDLPRLGSGAPTRAVRSAALVGTL